MLMNEETSRLYTMATIDDANVKSVTDDST